MYYLYILECKDGTLYTGITTDVERRFNEHKNGKGGKYTSAKAALRIVYTEEHPNRSEASKKESEIKKWTRRQKLEEIRLYSEKS
ncbi:MAG: GIY-YIG nuclease family protein [Parcubacteria group bacterium]|nr:GIY-YIG nuclease family protein [Parcubacteria group bacterium]